MPSESNMGPVAMVRHLWHNPRDSKYFFSLPGLASAIGAIGLAAIGIPEMRQQLKGWIAPALWEWGSANAVLVICLLGLLTVLPIFTDRLRTRVLMQKRELKKNTELSTAAASFSLRTAHLITKTQDAIRDERDGRYLQHTLIECCKYFKQRAIKVNGVDPDAQVNAVLFEVVCDSDGTPRQLERRKHTHVTNGDFSPNITRTRNRVAGELLDGLISARNPVFENTESGIASLLEAMKMAATDYQEFLIVPVHIDRKADGVSGIYGALMLMAEQRHTLRATDHVLLAAYAWYCSAALSVDRVTKGAKL